MASTIPGTNVTSPLIQAANLLSAPDETKQLIADFERAKQNAESAQSLADVKRREADALYKDASVRASEVTQEANDLLAKAQGKWNEAENMMAQVEEARKTLDEEKRTFTINANAQAQSLNQQKDLLNAREKKQSEAAAAVQNLSETIAIREQAVGAREAENAQIRADLDARIAKLRAAVA